MKPHSRYSHSHHSLSSSSSQHCIPAQLAFTNSSSFCIFCFISLTTTHDFHANPGQCQMLCCKFRPSKLSKLFLQPLWSCFIICQLKFLMLLSSSEMHYLCIPPHLNFPMPSSIYMSLCSLNTISFRIVYIHPQFELFSFSSEFSSHFFFTSFYLYFYLVVVLFVCILPTCLG